MVDKSETINDVIYIRCERHGGNITTECSIMSTYINIEGKKDTHTQEFQGDMDVSVYDPSSAFMHKYTSDGALAYHYSQGNGKCLVRSEEGNRSKTNEIFCSRDEKK